MSGNDSNLGELVREAMDQVRACNSKILSERRCRSPVIDAHTGLLQKDCRLWRTPDERLPPSKPGQYLSYRPAKWTVKKRLRPEDLWCVEKVLGAPSTQGPQLDRVPTQVYGTSPMPSSSVKGSSSLLGDNVSVDDDASEEEDFNNESDSSGSDEDFHMSSKKNRSTNSLQPRKKVVKSNPTTLKTFPSSLEPRKKDCICDCCGRLCSNSANLMRHQASCYERRKFEATSKIPSSMVPEPMESPLPLPGPMVDPCPATSIIEEPEETTTYCDFCLGDGSLNKKTGRREEMVSCADCGRSAHPVCLNFSEKLCAAVKSYRWQCIECKSCHVCGTSDNDEQLLFCDDCDRGYHIYCLVPPISEPPEGSWQCKLCESR